MNNFNNPEPHDSENYQNHNSFNELEQYKKEFLISHLVCTFFSIIGPILLFFMYNFKENKTMEYKIAMKNILNFHISYQIYINLVKIPLFVSFIIFSGIGMIENEMILNLGIYGGGAFLVLEYLIIIFYIINIIIFIFKIIKNKHFKAPFVIKFVK